MHGEMPLEPEQLEVVFDSLDADGNGYLTFDEFIQGFGKYMQMCLILVFSANQINGSLL